MKIKTTFKMLMASAVLIPALVLGLIGSLQYNSFYSTDESEKATYSALSASLTVREFFSNQAAELTALSCTDAVKKAAAGDRASVKDGIAKLTENELASPYVLDFVIMDSNGLVVSGSNEASLQKTFFDYGDPLLATDLSGCYVSPLYIDSDKYFETVFVITKPVLSTSGANGYVSRVISAKAVCDMLTECSFLDGGRMALIDSAGNAINYTAGQVTRSSETQGADVTTVKASAANGAFAAANQKYLPLNSGGSLGAYGKISGTDWLWVGIYAQKSTIVPILVGLAVFALCALLCGAVGFVVYRRLVTPMENISKAIEEIRSGNRDCRLPYDGIYDFGFISSVFNGMMDDASISEEVHRTISDMSDNLLFEWNLDENKMLASDKFNSMFRIDLNKASLLNGTFLDSRMEDKDCVKYRRDLSALLNGNRDYIENEYRIKTANNEFVWFSLRAKAIVTRMGDVTRIIGVVTDINDEKQQSLSLSQRASYDFLSQLYNRSTFMRELQNKLDLRRVNEEFAILFVDVDDFKFINDRYGHNVGDEVIKFVSDTLKNKLGSDGLAGRFGGDEFVMCVTNTALTKEIDTFSMDIIDKLYEGYHCKTESFDTILNIRASIGISMAPANGNTATELVGMADEAMYFVKKNGKSNYHIYDPGDAADPDLANTLV